MLDNIKSVYFSKIIFSFLNEEVKVKIVYLIYQSQIIKKLMKKFLMRN